jgi:hypothetical protein
MMSKILNVFLAGLIVIAAQAGTSPDRTLEGKSVRYGPGGGLGSFQNTTDTFVYRNTSDTLTNKSISGTANTITNIQGGSIANGTLQRAAIAAGTANHVLINDSSGLVSSQAQLSPSRGGTGVNNATNLTYGADDITLTTAGTTNVTLPTTGTLATLAGSETLTNKTMTLAANIFGASVASGVITTSNHGTLLSQAALDTARGGTAGSSAISGFNNLSPTTTKGDLIVRNDSGHNVRFPVGANAQVLQSDSTSTNGISWVTAATSADQSYEINNLGASVVSAANALTIALKTKSGSDPSAGSPVKIGFKSSATNGQYNQRTVSGALSMAVSSGSTLGQSNLTTEYGYIYAIDNAGTVELAVSSKQFDDGALLTTTAEGGAGAADGRYTIYSTSARTSVPSRLIGRFKSSQTVAGTWALQPSEISIWPFFGQEIRSNVSNQNLISAHLVHTGGTYSVSRADGDFITSISKTGTGDITLTFVTGLFSSAPNVTTAPRAANVFVRTQADTSSTSVRVQMNDGSGSATDSNFYIMLIGPR